MIWIRSFMDWSQILLSLVCAVYGIYILFLVDRTKRHLTEEQLQNLYRRERCRFSVQSRVGIIVVYCLYFALIQFTWTIDNQSTVLSFSEDFRWFGDGIIKLLIMITGLVIYRRLWKNWTRFRQNDQQASKIDTSGDMR